ncbi:Hypothetical_protein [Hexamita inflata]|uniref:Hypothetical_protein n=1 Tax=Hexamita inflata TaxID=28002 RepID=A0AA86U2T4_9EUKA|nr:Hypothetical protein HINF_LOCUS25964 [Hexamita inflata]
MKMQNYLSNYLNISHQNGENEDLHQSKHKIGYILAAGPAWTNIKNPHYKQMKKILFQQKFTIFRFVDGREQSGWQIRLNQISHEQALEINSLFVICTLYYL